MKKWLSLITAAVLALTPVCAFAEETVTETAEDARPRVIVTTDLECDDMNSLIHMALFFNDLDVDGIVYSAFVSLGFAALENIHYVFSYGLSVAFSRAIFSIPGHFSFSVFMGFYYGRAKLAEADGYEAGKKRNLFLAFLIPVLLHGFYDACAMSGSDVSMGVFLVFVVLMYIIVYRLVKRSSQEDTPIYRSWF